MEIGMIGLGRMGKNMALRLLQKKHKVAVNNRSPEPIKELAKQGAKAAYTTDELITALKKPRIIWMMLPAGEVTESHLTELLGKMSPEDIMIEGGNSNYKDSVRRAKMFATKGIQYLDVGTSGGVVAAKLGYCLMIGGDKKAFQKAEPIFRDLSTEKGYGHMGPSGSGHYVKMVHNAIEYGMMQAIAEGMELLTKSPYQKEIDLRKITGVWNHGSIVRSFLMEMIGQALSKDPALKGTIGYVEDNGEGRWAIQEAIDRDVAFSVITASLYARFNSREKDPFSAKALQAMRHEFGGHEVKK